MMYLFPLLDVAGKRPVWLLCIILVALWIFDIDVFHLWECRYVSFSFGQHLGWLNPLVLFFHMLFLCFVWFWEVLLDRGRSICWPCVEVSCFDFFGSCVFDWESFCRMRYFTVWLIDCRSYALFACFFTHSFLVYFLLILSKTLLLLIYNLGRWGVWASLLWLCLVHELLLLFFLDETLLCILLWPICLRLQWVSWVLV